MFQESFEKLELEEIATILDAANPHLEGARFDPVETTILALPLDFYPGFRLLDIADHTSMPPQRRHLIYKPGTIVVLDFTNAPVYGLNKSVPIKLDQDNVTEYVRFFFSYVRGKKGRFIVTENIDDIRWKEEPPANARKAIGNMIEPLALQGTDDQGHYKLEGCFTYKDALFKSKITVDKTGVVIMTDERLLIEDMPVLDDTFGQ